jgi:hypothetical protein
MKSRELKKTKSFLMVGRSHFIPSLMISSRKSLVTLLENHLSLYSTSLLKVSQNSLEDQQILLDQTSPKPHPNNLGTWRDLTQETISIMVSESMSWALL